MNWDVRIKNYVFYKEMGEVTSKRRFRGIENLI